MVLTQTLRSMNVIKVWGSKGAGNGQFNRPHDLDFSTDEKDSIFCR